MELFCVFLGGYWTAQQHFCFVAVSTVATRSVPFSFSLVLASVAGTPRTPRLSSSFVLASVVGLSCAPRFGFSLSFDPAAGGPCAPLGCSGAPASGAGPHCAPSDPSSGLASAAGRPCDASVYRHAYGNAHRHACVHACRHMLRLVHGCRAIGCGYMCRNVYAFMRRHDHVCHNYTGNNYVGHTSIGHNYTGHKYIGHNYVGHKFVRSLVCRLVRRHVYGRGPQACAQPCVRALHRLVCSGVRGGW